ncbi:HNH endonuclease signature motif containing protein [Arthrobacter sp. SPG23]|uniref:HNH endonuclease signature motif containing protein n=1 Tax=Arthrobacter sp. SPG23 TaxID=1610703 RepID=UPI000A44A2AD|nr:HNH endonuclease signature motif containing protein [Arthrobacter sp. SPG23]
MAAVSASTAELESLIETGADRAGSPCVAPLPATDPMRNLADACLEGLAEIARQEARTAALKVRLTAEYLQATRALASPASSPRERAVQEMALVAEVACVLTVSERSAGALLSECQTLTTVLPLTLTALQAGTISWQHARIIVDETTTLDPDGAAALEAHFLDTDAPTPARGCPAGDLVPTRFRAKARSWRERHHPVSIEKRFTKSAADRRVEYVPDRDGMAWLSAYLPAHTASGIWERTTAAARSMQGPDEARTLTQLRADVAATWLLTNGTGAASGTADGGTGLGGDVPSPRAQVLITVPVLSLLGATDEPSLLDGYGPIPASMARRLIADGADSFYRVLTDPRDGAPLEIGRTNYRLTKAQRQWLRLRDGKCPFPGCNNPSLDNEADHLLAWADGGTTGISNLGQPCRKHHRLKHNSKWKPTGASMNNPPGWTSPAGRDYPSEHQDWEPPHWPDHILATEETGRDPDLEPPEDPFPEWHQFTAAHEFPAADMDGPGWPAPLDDFLPEAFVPQGV